MPLSPGTRLGVYEVAEKIGEGGMGEVYRARDTKLDRDVALKVLPDLFANDPERLGRFQREAKVLASLNHPNIGSIYGLEEAEPSPQEGEPSDVARGFSPAVRALVLELIEGPTLADLIGQGPMTIEDALPIGRQMAEALEAAHEQGIIHRDLNEPELALQHFDQLLTLSGVSSAVRAAILSNTGLELLKLDRRQEAQDSLKRATEPAPDLEEPRHNLQEWLDEKFPKE